MTKSKQPLVTFALIAYNQAEYITEAIAAAFAQTYTPLEIILSDDFSQDNTFEIMQCAAADYKGPHRVILNRNPSNLNIGGHVNTIGRLASGELIVLAAGDDLSLPDRVSKLIEGWKAAGSGPMALCSDFEAIDPESRPVTLHSEFIYRGTYSLEGMAQGNVGVLGATSAVTADVFRSFPPMDVTVRHEDRVLPFRALLLGGKVTLIDEKLVRYRVTGGISRNLPTSAADFLFRYTPVALTRTLPDARQRLNDLVFIQPSEQSLRNQCRSTIATQEALIELSNTQGISLELSLLRWVVRRSHVMTLIGFYLKCRFLPLFTLYYNARQA